ncbi:MAG: glycosyltransferase family 39 protein [Anaerolineae bacterium]|nr:glycosyltransferase family 39 protein [Anaerolineae bacterium]
MTKTDAARSDVPLLPRWAEVVLLLLILAAAAYLRLAYIGQQPAGPHHDEAANAYDVLDVLSGRLMVFSPRPYGREMLGMYLITPLLALLGPTRLALRLPVALAGILTIFATYLLARELFRQEGRRLAQLAGLLAALFLTLSFWLLALNRIGFRANYVPLTETLCFLFLFRTLRTDRLSDYVLSGFFLGLSFHTYISARFIPVVLLVFFCALLVRRDPLTGARGWVLLASRWRRWLLLAAVALLVAGPLLVHFLAHPDDFLQRARGVSIFSSSLHQGDPLGLWLRSLAGNLGLFGLTGDTLWLYNLPGRPGMDPVQAVLFWLGVGLCLIRLRQPRYIFLAVWWPIMLLPSILAPDPIPHYLRANGVLPAAAIIAARPLAGWLSSLSLPVTRLRLKTAAPLVLLVALPVYAVWAGYDLWHTYFRVWLSRDEVYYAYYGYLADLAEQINNDPDPDSVYLFPVNYDRRDDNFSAYTLELLHRGPTPFRYIFADDATVARDLTDICAGKRRVKLVVWTHGEHIDADPRQVLPLFLERFGRRLEERALRGYRIVTYELPSTAVDFSLPLDFTDVSVDYGPLWLATAAYSPTAPSGEPAWVVLRWQAVQPMAVNYRVSLRLFDAAGHLIGQVDGDLMDNDHRFSSQWLPGQDATTYHLLPSLPGTLPGAARLALVVYDPDSLQAVIPPGSSDDQLALGSVEITRPEQPAVVQAETPLPKTRLARGMELIGYSQDRESLVSGEALHLALYWHVRRDIARDYRVVIRLVDGAGSAAAEWAQAPAYPTVQWQAGDLWRDRRDLPLPPGVSPGQYHLVVEIEGSDLDGNPTATLGQVAVGASP